MASISYSIKDFFQAKGIASMALKELNADSNGDVRYQTILPDGTHIMTAKSFDKTLPLMNNFVREDDKTPNLFWLTHRRGLEEKVGGEVLTFA